MMTKIIVRTILSTPEYAESNISPLLGVFVAVNDRQLGVFGLVNDRHLGVFEPVNDRHLGVFEAVNDVQYHYCY